MIHDLNCYDFRFSFGMINILVLQLAVIRPFLMFIAAVAWTDGVYEAGSVSIYTIYHRKRDV